VRRLHQALGYRAPMAVWREGAAPTAHGHVDNASALTTCPQADGSESADRTPGGVIKDNQQTAFQLNRRQKRSRFAGPLHGGSTRKCNLAGSHRSPQFRTHDSLLWRHG
jgi:hypothetical protein